MAECAVGGRWHLTFRRQVACQSRPRVAAARQHTHVGPLLVPGMCAPAGTSLLVPGAGAEPLSRLKERAPFTVCFPAATSLSHNVCNIQLLVLRSLRSALQSSINVPLFEAIFQSLVRCLTGLRLSEFWFFFQIFESTEFSRTQLDSMFPIVSRLFQAFGILSKEIFDGARTKINIWKSRLFDEVFISNLTFLYIYIYYICIILCIIVCIMHCILSI